MPPQAFLALLLFLPCCAQALFGSSNETDFWEDFGNNFATDLAPIISLFGEQVTKQFLSESTTILDTILFAVGPLGIITAIVSCIRVSSSSFLKSVVGRARESHAVPEVELCSSTSDSVCELWSNGGICRVFGRPKILEFVTRKCADEYFYAQYDEEGIETVPATCGILLIREYLRESESDRKVTSFVEALSERLSKWSPRRFVLQTANWIGARTRNSVGSPGTTSSPGYMEQGRASLSSKEEKEAKSQGREEFAPFPNLALNMGVQKAQTLDLTLSLAAAFGVLLQGSFFGYTTWATWYHPTFYQGGKASNAPLFFTCTIAGTASIILGMALCATLIDRNSKEQRLALSSTKGTETSDLPKCLIFWLQPGGQRIGDQEFDAFACSEAKTEYIASWKDRKAPVPIFLVWLGVGLSFAGWMVQFIGLRGQHATVALYQLCCTIIMSIIRASVRSSRSTPRNELEHASEELRGHELDWQALRLVGPCFYQAHWILQSPVLRNTPTRNILEPLVEMRIGDSAAIALSWGSQEEARNLMRWIESDNSDFFALAQDSHSKPEDILKKLDLGHVNSGPPNMAAKSMRIRARLAHLTKQLQPYQAWELDTRRTAVHLKNALQKSTQILYSGQSFGSLVWSTNCRLLGTEPHKDQEMPICFCMTNTTTGWTIDENQLEAVLGFWSWSLDRYIAGLSPDARDSFQRERRKRILINPNDSAAICLILKQWGLPKDVLGEETITENFRTTNLSVQNMVFDPSNSTSPSPGQLQTLLSIDCASSLLQMMAQDIFTTFVETIGSLRFGGPEIETVLKTNMSDTKETILLENMVHNLVSEGLANRNEAIMSVVPAMCPRSGDSDSVQAQDSLLSRAVLLKRRGQFGESQNIVETLAKLGSSPNEKRAKALLFETYRSELRWMMHQRCTFANQKCIKRRNEIVQNMYIFGAARNTLEKIYISVIDWLLWSNRVSPTFVGDDDWSINNVKDSSVLKSNQPTFGNPAPLEKEALDDLELDWTESQSSWSFRGSWRNAFELALTLDQRFNLGESSIEVRRQLLRWAIESGCTGLVEDLWFAERKNHLADSAFSSGSDELFWAAISHDDYERDTANTILFLLEVVEMDQCTPLKCREEMDRDWWRTSQKKDFIESEYERVSNVLAAAVANPNGLGVIELLTWDLKRKDGLNTKYMCDAVRSALDRGSLRTFDCLMTQAVEWRGCSWDLKFKLLPILAEWGLKQRIGAILRSLGGHTQVRSSLELSLAKARIRLPSEQEKRAKEVFESDRDGLVAFLEKELA